MDPIDRTATPEMPSGAPASEIEAPVVPVVDSQPVEPVAVEREVPTMEPSITAEPAAEAEVPAVATGPDAGGPWTVGRYVADSLRAAGVRIAYTVPGESFLPLLEALTPAGIRVVATRHENGASFAAEAHGQLTGRPAACLATRAVGAANLAIGIQTAREDSTPMFAIVGGVERARRGREAFQEADIAGSIGRLAKWSAEPTDAAAVPGVMAEAIRQALSGRPGPVVLALAEDLLDEPMPSDAVLPATGRGPGERIDPSTIGSILHLLTGARRPLILAGAGVLRARCTNDLVKLAEMVRVPVVTSWRRGDAFPQ
jgi:acetolactate synthase-1/2/3 large subunit